MYKKNDTIIYGSQGVCQISDIIQKDGAEYYILIPRSAKNATVFVPVGNELLTAKMHPILSKQEIYDLIEALPKTHKEWNDNEPQRKEHYKKILASGDRAELAQQINLIYLHKKDLHTKKKRLHNCDEQFVNLAEKVLYDEFSYVLDIGADEIAPLIAHQIT